MKQYKENDTYKAARTIQRFIRGYLVRCMINNAFDELDECAHEIERIIQRQSVPTYSVEITRESRRHIIRDMSCGYYIARSSVYSHPLTKLDQQELGMKSKLTKKSNLSSADENVIDEKAAVKSTENANYVHLASVDVTVARERNEPPVSNIIERLERPHSILRALDDDALIARALQLEKLIHDRIQVLVA